MNQFCELISAEGYRVWVDHDGISSGAVFADVISKAITESKMVLFFSSVESNASKWVRRELIFADSNNKKILPILIDDSEYNQAFKLLLSGVEHIDARNGLIKDVESSLLFSLESEIGNRSGNETCPVVRKPCPVDKQVPEPNQDVHIEDYVIRHKLRVEALVFAALCGSLWLVLLGTPLLYLGILVNPYAILFSCALSLFFSLYATHQSTLSTNVPGWYNRNLTTYGAMIIALEAYITLFFMSVSALITNCSIFSITCPVVSLLGVIAMSMVFKLKKLGYYLLWILGVSLSIISYFAWPAHYSVVGIVVSLIIYSLLMLILTATLCLSNNGNNGASTWRLLFGKKECFGVKITKVVERFLLGIWNKIY